MEEAGGLEWIEVGRYLRRNQAEERSLVLMAQRLRHRVVEHDGLFCLLVHEEHIEAASRELSAYEAERSSELQQRRIEASQPAPPPFRKKHIPALLLYIWLMIGFFAAQAEMPMSWSARGTATASAILGGEWWRTLTALTLHADSGHLVANICVGLIFIAALLPLLGGGWTWFAILLSGALGNALNAWGHRAGEHHSVGASTAIFGALGLLVAWQLVAVIRGARGSGRRPRWREVLVPLAAGLALLAYLGVGDGSEHSRVDITAHLFGMLAGLLLGLPLAALRIPEHTPGTVQKGLLLITLLLLTGAWYLAVHPVIPFSMIK